jgi:hypothetical protein
MGAPNSSMMVRPAQLPIASLSELTHASYVFAPLKKV